MDNRTLEIWGPVIVGTIVGMVSAAIAYWAAPAHNRKEIKDKFVRLILFVLMYVYPVGVIIFFSTQRALDKGYVLVVGFQFLLLSFNIALEFRLKLRRDLTKKYDDLTYNYMEFLYDHKWVTREIINAQRSDKPISHERQQEIFDKQEKFITDMEEKLLGRSFRKQG